MRENITTTNLGDFGWRELKIARDLLDKMIEEGLPDEFYDEGVEIMFNRHSGKVFLVNEEFQVAMLNGDELEMFYSCPECGAEGFADEIEWDKEKRLCGECAE